MPDIGERVANIRLMRMWTQARLAQEAGVSPTTVSGIETSKIGRPFRWDGLETLGRATSRAGLRTLPSKASTPSLADWTLSKSASSDFMESFPRVASRGGS